MPIKSQKLTIYSSGLYYTEILTDRIQRIVTELEVRMGCVNLVLQHTTSALMLIEHEAGIILDLKSILQKLVPRDGEYYHHRRGVDQNGAGHVLSALLNRTLSIPIVNGFLLLGTYQEIMFMDFQPEETARVLAVTMYGEQVC